MTIDSKLESKFSMKRDLEDRIYHVEKLKLKDYADLAFSGFMAPIFLASSVYIMSITATNNKPFSYLNASGFVAAVLANKDYRSHVKKLKESIKEYDNYLGMYEEQLKETEQQIIYHP